MEDKPEWPEVMTFEPTMAEFSNLMGLLQYMESKGAHKAGIAKIRPPKEWVARARGYQPCDIQLEIQAPVQQTIAPTEVPGAFQANHSNLPKLKIEDYRKLATKPCYVTPSHESYDELENLYWEELVNDRSDPPIYGADVCDSITDPEQKIWNIRKLESILTEEMEEQIPGVNMPYLYFGMWRATFSWHVEDMDLYGVNFLHYGAPKTWYCVPPQYAYKLEAAAVELFPGMSKACFNLLRHKAVMLSPDLLQEFGVRTHKVVQEERDMIIVFPHAYHSGFNHGFNIAESTNFALPRWIDYGMRFRGCLCGDKDNAVSVNMEPFILKYRPELLDGWKTGKDFSLHPEDPKHIKQAYADAKLRLSSEDLKKFQIYLKERREIPDWFRMMQEQGNTYKDKIDLFRYYDISDFVEDWTLERRWSPKHRAALRKLLEDPNNCGVSLKKLEKIKVFTYMRKLKRQDRYESSQKKDTKDISMHYTTGVVSAGFAAANIADMMAKKNRTSCIRKHRFRHCRKCSGCRTPNCGQCRNCKDMIVFGGPGTSKQKCMKRVCSNPVMQSCEYCKWDVDAS